MTVAWITGGRGFIGRNLAVLLAKRGYSVIGVGHGLWSDISESTSPYTHWCNGEVEAANLSQLTEVFGRPETVFHLAGGSSVGGSFANPKEDFARTVETTSRLLEWLRQNAGDVGVVAVSSAAVYGQSSTVQISEKTPLNPYSPYGFHKMMMEALCRSYGYNYGLRISIIRLFSVYGPGLYRQLIWDICCKLENVSQRIIRLDGTGGETRDWLHVSDAVRLLFMAAQRCTAESEIINGGTGVGTTIRAVAEMACRAWPSEVAPDFSGRQRKGDPSSLIADPVHASMLGFSPRIGILEGIQEVIDWYRASRGIP